MMDEQQKDGGQVKLPVLAGLHAFFALSKQVGFTCEALVVVLSNTGLTRSVAGFAFLPRLLLVVACWALIHTGAICTNKHTITGAKQTSQMPDKLSRTHSLERNH